MINDRLNAPMRLAAIKLHGLMNQAKDAPAEKRQAAWYIVFRGLLIAHKNDELRADISERFVTECPKEGKGFKTLHLRYDKEIAGLPQPKPTAPIRKGRAQRKREGTFAHRVIHVAAEAASASA